ncbi:hypothetical protein D9M68_953820 [compost metagenome]
MKLNTLNLAAFLALGSVAGNIYAEPMVYGHGSKKCGSFVAAIEEKRAGNGEHVYQFMVWTSGYASAWSAEYKFDYFKNADTKSLEIWLDNYCQKNPLDTYLMATIKLLGELRDR